MESNVRRLKAASTSPTERESAQGRGAFGLFNAMVSRAIKRDVHLTALIIVCHLRTPPVPARLVVYNHHAEPKLAITAHASSTTSAAICLSNDVGAIVASPFAPEGVEAIVELEGRVGLEMRGARMRYAPFSRATEGECCAM